MEQINSGSGIKRSYQEFLAEDILHKLRSKEDFYIYMDKHRK